MSDILVVMGHSNSNSFCAALAEAYQQGALSQGFDCQRLDGGKLKFDPVLKMGFRGEQPLEPDLQQAQQLIQQARHLVWVYPNWWGGLPSLLKGFIDRTFLPGFAFKYQGRNLIPAKLLKGRSARILMTLDTPVWWYRYGMGAPGVRAMKESILNFSGIAPVKTTLMGPNRGSSEQQRQAWLKLAEQLGRQGA